MVQIGKCNIPASWSEMTWKQLIEYSTNENYLTLWGVPERALIEQYELIFDALKFLTEPFEQLECELDVIEMEFGRYVDAVQYVRHYAKQPILAYPYLVAIYTTTPYKYKSMLFKYEDVLKQPFLKTYHIAKHAFEVVVKSEQNISEHCKNFPTLQPPLKKGQKQGYDYSKILSTKYGYYHILDSLANGDILREEQIANLCTFDAVEKIKYKIEVNYHETKRAISLL